MKRAAEIALALVLGVVTAPVLLLAAIAIALNSRGPVLFVQKRLGRGERPFRLYKLRTMYSGTGDHASHEVDSGAITRVGRFLRRSKLDEVPQLLNVLKGEMSFVGPRPGLPGQGELAAARRQAGVFAINPGITGLAQVRAIDMSDPELLARVDREYMQTQSLAGDLSLLARTFAGAGRGDAALAQGNEPVRILLANRYFWPDTPPDATILRAILLDLASAGHQVTIWTEQPNYKPGVAVQTCAKYEICDGLRVERFGRLPFWNKVKAVHDLDKLLFPVRIVLKALRSRLKGRRFDIVWTATQPPVLNAFGSLLAARILGGKLLYHCLDIYPELGPMAGLWRETGVLHRIMLWLDNFTMRRMGMAVVPGEDMAETLRRRPVANDKIRIISNFTLDANQRTNRPAAKQEDAFTFIFAGNLGRFQDLHLFVAAMELLGNVAEIRLRFLGEGRELANLQAAAAANPAIEFLPHLPFAQAKGIIAAANVGIVSIQPDIYRVAYPSKTQTYLDLDLPVLVLVEQTSELARMVQDHDVGRVIAARTPEAIAAAMREMWLDRGSVQRMAGNARKTGQALFSREIAATRFRELVVELAG